MRSRDRQASAYTGRTRATPQALLLGVLCTCLTLAACAWGPTDGQRSPGAPTAIPDLQGKGVSRIPLPDAVLQHHTVIGGLATYEAPATPPPGAASATDTVRVIAAIGDENGLYEDVGLQGASPHPLALASPCSMGLSVTQDGQWGACITAQGVATIRLQAPNASPGPMEEHVVAAIDPGYLGADVSWDPTGRYLAVAQISNTDTSNTSATAPLDVLALAPDHAHATLAVQLSGIPSLDFVRWSPDGRWLDIDVRGPIGQGYLLPLTQLLPTLPTYAHATVQATATLGSLQSVPYGTAWRPGTAPQLTDVEAGHLDVWNPTTYVTQDIADLGFTPDNTYSSVCAETWTTDGRYFVFALCDTNYPEFVGLPPKLFVYDAQAQ